MSISRSEYVYPGALTPVRLLSTANLAGNYVPQTPNSGINATLTNNGSLAALTIDSVVANNGDYVCLSAQTDATQNGMYEVLSAGSTSSAWSLVRRGDFQVASQLRAGMFTTVGAGTANHGKLVTLVEPLPAVIGTNNVVFVVNA